ncbi:helix-turn-helix domain-containing protein [Microbacterium aoyamense]|nr:helix-turn-helix domain-containing protein [Microbacterium aoyamense]
MQNKTADVSDATAWESHYTAWAIDDGDFGESLAELRCAALQHIEERHRTPTFGVDHIARELYISRRQLYRAFPDSGGIANLIARRRLASAEDLLVGRPDLSLAEVAGRSGFSTAGVMRAHFRRQYGVTPQQRRDAILRARQQTI